MAVIRVQEAMRRQVEDYLNAAAGERFGFLQCNVTRGSDGPIFLPQKVHFVPDESVSISETGYSVAVPELVEIVNSARRSGQALIEYHNHHGSMPRFSAVDRNGLAEFVPYVLRRLPGLPYAATVWSNGTVYGEVFVDDMKPTVIRRVTSVGSALRQLVTRDDDIVQPDAVFNRQVLWLGNQVQREIGRFRVGIVGVGGTGSHMAQLLAYFGFQNFTIVDNDEADRTSINRTVTATFADAGARKADLARHLICSVNPHAQVLSIPDRVQSRESLESLKSVDVLFGCVDNDGARLVLNELSLAYEIPYLDIATGIEVADGETRRAGGRLCFVGPTGPCLVCMGEIDWEEARFFLSSESEQADQVQRGYVTGFTARSPSVVSINGALANLAVNEIALWCAALRPPTSFLVLDLLGRAHGTARQRLTERIVEANPDCVECQKRGTADQVCIERYAP